MTNTNTAEWYSHVKNTPAGFVPVLINGFLPAYQIAMGTDFTASAIRDRFEATPQEFWPYWLKEMQP